MKHAQHVLSALAMVIIVLIAIPTLGGNDARDECKLTCVETARLCRENCFNEECFRGCDSELQKCVGGCK